MLELMARGGMRIGEVLKLTPRDFNSIHAFSFIGVSIRWSPFKIFDCDNLRNVNLKIKGPKKLCLTNISLNGRIDKIAAAINEI